MRRLLSLTAATALLSLAAAPTLAAGAATEVPVRGNLDLTISCRGATYVPHNGTLLETRETVSDDGITYEHVTQTEGSTLTFRDLSTGKIVHIDPLHGPGTPGTSYVGWFDAAGSHHEELTYAWTWRQGNVVETLSVTRTVHGGDTTVDYDAASSCELVG